MAPTFYTISYITLNVLTAVLSIVGLTLQRPRRTPIFNRVSIYVLSILGMYSVISLLFCGVFHTLDYYALAFPFCLLLGPAFYLLSLARRGEKTDKMIFLHLIPFILSLPFYVVFITNDNFRYQYYASYYWIIYLFAFFSVVGYCTWSVLLWSERIGTRSYALLQREGLAMILFLLACSTLLVTSSKIWRGSFYVDMQEIAHTFFYLITLFLAWELSVRVWVNRGVLSYRGAYHSAKIYPSVESTEEDKPDNDGFTSEQKHEYKRSVELFIQKKGFADPKLNRDKFIEKTKIPSRHLGSFLHNTYGKGFSAFINKLRVDYVAEELGKSDFEGTIDDLGLACGFRSRASFYRNFTAEFGCSPLEYRTNNLVMG